MLTRIIPILEFMSQLKTREKNKYIDKAPSSVIKWIADLCFNILLGNFFLEKNILIQLKPYKRQLQNFSAKKITLNARKKILKKKNFLTQLISIILPTLFSYLNKNDVLKKNVSFESFGSTDVKRE